MEMNALRLKNLEKIFVIFTEEAIKKSITLRKKGASGRKKS
jgi:hypothetical protein